MGSAAESSFERVIAALDALGAETEVREWVRTNEAALQAAYNDAYQAASAEGDDLAPFAPARAAQRLLTAATHFIGENGLWSRFRRPCCSDLPLIYPFCNRAC